MVAPNLSDPFFRQLYKRLAEEIDSRVNALAAGSALTFGEVSSVDAITTAMKYQAAVSYIEALQAVLELGVQFDNERYGTKTKDGDE